MVALFMSDKVMPWLRQVCTRKPTERLEDGTNASTSSPITAEHLWIDSESIQLSTRGCSIVHKTQIPRDPIWNQTIVHAA